MERRRFLELTAASAAARLITASGIAVTEAAPRVKAIAFDGFVIFDPRPIAALAEALFPGQGTELGNAWRTRQFEYTWLRTLTGNYADFAQVTREALGAFFQLQAWPDVLPTLTALKNAGIRMAFLSDLTAGMLDLSTDRVRAFKPDPRAYQMGLDSFKLKREEIVFAAHAL